MTALIRVDPSAGRDRPLVIAWLTALVALCWACLVFRALRISTVDSALPATLPGAMLAAGLTEGITGQVAGTLAVALAAVNVFGGFLVTQRMLEMFKKKEPKAARDAKTAAGAREKEAA